MKSLLKKILNKAGFEVSKKVTVNRFSETVDSVFSPIRNNVVHCYNLLKEKGFYPDLVIDVGVADGTPELTTAFENAYFIWVEPLIEFEDVLKKLKQQHKGEYHLLAAGRESGKIVFNVHEDLAGSSFLSEQDDKAADGVSREIVIKELDKIVKDNLKKNIVLKIDVQGAELDVLEGSKEILKNTEAVVLEVSLFKFQHNSPDFYEVIAYMKDKGFVVYDLFHGHNRPLDKALAQVDIVFVKESGRFRTSHKWATLEQRKLIDKEKKESRRN